MSGRGSKLGGARLLWAAGCAGLCSAPAYAQTAPAQQAPPPATEPELDPNAPLAVMPDLGVEWPDLNAKDTTPPPSQPTAQPQKNAAPARETEANGTLRCTVAVEGLSTIGSAENL